jgi:PAS domain S-box-containing protein
VLVAERLNWQAELAQREQQRILRAVLDNAPLGIWLVNAAGRPLFVNRAFCDAVGISEGRFLAVPHYAQLFDEATAQNCLTSDRAALTQSRPHISCEQMKFADGQWHKLEIIKVRMLAEAGQPTGIIGLYLDVTERDRVQTALQESEQRYRALLEVSPNAIFINRAGRVTFINPAGLRLFGAERPEQILGRDAAELFHPDCRNLVEGHLRALLAEQKPIGLIEKKIMRLDGSTVAVEISAAPFTDQGVTAIQLILCDITYRKKLEDQLRQSQKMEAIGTLAGGIAHDFNNLLAIIQGHTEVILMESGLAPEMAGSLRQISKAAKRAATLTRQLLTFSRKTHLQVQPLELNEVISQLVKMLRRLIREDIDLECHYSGEPLSLLADAGMMDQILLNLTINARDAMPQGGRLCIRTERFQVDAAYQHRYPRARPGPFAKLTVTDSGTGIAPENLARIFDPFFTTKGVGKGTGLGLATVHGIVEQHRGWIEVDSRPGTGTTFRVFLPIHEATPAEMAKPNAEITAPVPGGHETVLLVEDEIPLLTIVSQILRQKGYQVLEATSGVAALELWKKHAAEIDLLLTDIVMPQGYSGVTLAETLQTERPGLKVLLTSGYSHELDQRPSPAGKPWQVLEKPAPPQRLLEAVRHCLDA